MLIKKWKRWLSSNFFGETGTGAKTSLINRIIDNSFNYHLLSTPGAYFKNFDIQTEFGKIKLYLWDTCSQIQSRALNSVFIKKSHCIILGYDI